jgi:hypothetical protein
MQYLLPTQFGLPDLAPIRVLNNRLSKLDQFQENRQKDMICNLQINGTDLNMVTIGSS